MTKPVILIWSRHTLFQTRRKMVDELALGTYKTGALDRSLEPAALWLQEQAMAFVDWMLEHADLIQLARNRRNYRSHYCVSFLGDHHTVRILTPEGTADAMAEISLKAWSDLYTTFVTLAINCAMWRNEHWWWARINYEYDDLPI